ATRRMVPNRALLAFRELSVELESERKWTGPEGCNGARQGLRGDLHHAIGNRDSVGVGHGHPQAGLQTEAPQFSQREALAAVPIGMAGSPGGRRVVGEEGSEERRGG